MTVGDDPHLDKLIEDGDAMAYARHRPCVICGKTPWVSDTYAIVIKGQVYCGRCYTNARELIPND